MMLNSNMIDKRIENEKWFWNKIADGYDKPSKLDKAYELSIKNCNKILTGKENVIDIACGTGKITLGIAENAQMVVGLDVSEKMINVANKKKMDNEVNNVNFEVGDGYHTRFDNGSFDIVMLFNSIHIVKEPDKLLAEAYRLIKTNGYLITATDCYSEQLPFSKKVYSLVPRLMKKLGIISYLNCFKKKDVELLIKKSNFHILQTDVLYHAPINYYVLAKKED